MFGDEGNRVKVKVTENKNNQRCPYLKDVPQCKSLITEGILFLSGLLNVATLSFHCLVDDEFSTREDCI